MYFTFEMTVVGGQTAQAVYKRADYKAALSAHHSVIASALANSACSEALSMIINERGMVLASEYYNAQEV